MGYAKAIKQALCIENCMLVVETKFVINGNLCSSTTWFTMKAEVM